MQPNYRVGVLLIGVLLSPTSVAAQIVVSPLQAMPGRWERVSIQVTNPLDSPIVAIRIEVPAEMIVAGVEPHPEWPFEIDSLAGGGHAIEWRGGWVAQGELQEFGFLARIRSDIDADQVMLPTHLTRVGGDVESWMGGGDAPAPRIFVDRTPELTSQGTAMLGVVALVVSVIALAIAMVARFARPSPPA